MALIYKNHTLSAVNYIKKEITTIVKVISIVVAALFLGYYAYLIVKNILDFRLPFLIAYSAMLVVSTLAFIFLFVFDRKDTDTREKKNAKKDKRRRSKRILRVIKYGIQVATITLAIIQLAQVNGGNIMIITTVGSIVALLISVIADVVSTLINKYIDYLVLSIKLDAENSEIYTKFKLEGKIARVEKELDDLEGNSRYSSGDQKIVDHLTKMAKEREETESTSKVEKKNKLKSLKERLKEARKNRKK